MVGLSSSTTLNQHKSLVHPLIHDGHSIENHQGSVAPPKPIQASEPPARTTAKLVVLLRGKTPPSKTARDKKAKRKFDVILDLEIHKNKGVHVMFCEILGRSQFTDFHLHDFKKIASPTHPPRFARGQGLTTPLCGHLPRSHIGLVEPRHDGIHCLPMGGF